MLIGPRSALSSTLRVVGMRPVMPLKRRSRKRNRGRRVTDHSRPRSPLLSHGTVRRVVAGVARGCHTRCAVGVARSRTGHARLHRAGSSCAEACDHDRLRHRAACAHAAMPICRYHQDMEARYVTPVAPPAGGLRAGDPGRPRGAGDVLLRLLGPWRRHAPLPTLISLWWCRTA